MFINWHRYEAANVRFGQLKPAFGAEALLSDPKTLTVERSLSSDRLADGKLTVGVNGLWSEDANLARSDFGFTGNLFTGRRAMSGVDAQWTWRRLDLSAEWLRGTFEPVNATPRAKLHAQGWQATAAYFLWPAKLQGVVRCEAFDPNTDAGGNTFRTATFGLNYLIRGEDLKLMVDYLDGRVPGATNDGGRLLTRLQVIF